jgi:hypothetical protein
MYYEKNSLSLLMQKQQYLENDVNKNYQLLIQQDLSQITPREFKIRLTTKIYCFIVHHCIYLFLATIRI